MCGICTIAGPGSDGDTSALERMVAALEHRGPDARGILQQPGCQLGHARLSIIDLKSGAQSMKDQTGRYCTRY